MDESNQGEYPIVEGIKAGWAARGKGWAVHAPTKEDAIKKYHERVKYHEWLKTQPYEWERKTRQRPSLIVTGEWEHYPISTKAQEYMVKVVRDAIAAITEAITDPQGKGDTSLIKGGGE